MPTPAPTVTDHADFVRQLLELRTREKAHTRGGDAIAAARRRLPMTEVPPDTTVIGPDGPVPFGDVFEGRDELIVYSHRSYDGEPWEWQCEGCTRNSWNMGDAVDAAYLNANGITFAILGDGPYEEIAAFRDFMGYTAPWYSNAHVDDPTVGVTGRISCYLRREDRIYLTYWTTGRGDEVMSPSFGLLDMTAYGRREAWEDSPEGWPQFTMMAGVDLRGVIPSILTPTLVLVRRVCPIYDPGHGEYLAAHMANATIEQTHDANDPWWSATPIS